MRLSESCQAPPAGRRGRSRRFPGATIGLCRVAMRRPQGRWTSVPQGSGVEFGELLRRLRLAAGFSQEALAERAGLSSGAIAALERCRSSRPRPFTVRLLADALSLEAADRAALIEASTSPPAAASVEPAAAEPAAGAAPPLPVSLTTFVGREPELTELHRQLRVT